MTHALGLIAGHTANTSDIMYYQYNSDNSGKNKFTAEELGNLILIYRSY